MLNALIRLSLKSRPFVLMVALLLCVFGVRTAMELPVEVLPDLTKPTVTILTESPGLAPEETELLVTQPIESAIQGIPSLDRLRSNSDVGLSLVFAEFSWGTNLYLARQMVQERLQNITLPENAESGLAPISSLMGEILLVGVRSPDQSVSPMELRQIADWTIRKRLQSIPGVAEVLSIGGGVRQIHIQPDLTKLQAFQITLEELEEAAKNASHNATSGYLNSETREIMVRNLAMSTNLKLLAESPIKKSGNRVILIRDVATVTYDVQDMRGDASIVIKGDDPEIQTRGVILSIDKSQGFDTLKLTQRVEEAIEDLKPSLPEGVEMVILFRQGDFIEHALSNLKEAIVDGAIMVTVVLFLFLLNFRTTLITLTAMPLSFAVTILVFKMMGISVNSMTLGGLAVAIGMVVDDAIVDVENVYRRLKENASRAAPLPKLDVIASASGEVRNSILYATILIVLVFMPLLGLQGLEGQLFKPIAIATITSMAASFLVSLTVIPVLCSLLLSFRTQKIEASAPSSPSHEHDGILVRLLKTAVRNTFLKISLAIPIPVLVVNVFLLVLSSLLIFKMGGEFLPAFNEGSATIALMSPPSSSLKQTNELGEKALQLLREIPEIKSIGRRAGRAERDDHVVPVSVNEFDVEFEQEGRPREVVLNEIREKLSHLPGTFAAIGAPIAHRLSHMLSGVSAKIAVKVFGPELEELRRLSSQIEALTKEIPGMTDVMTEVQIPLPQLRIEVDREKAALYGIQPGQINDQVSALIGGKVLAELREGQRTVDLVLRLPDQARNQQDKIAKLLLTLPSGRHIPLSSLATVYESTGPNTINREDGQRRIVISANTTERDLEGMVKQLQEKMQKQMKFPDGYYPSFEGEYKARQEAASRILITSTLVLGVIALLLYQYFRSVILALQVLLTIPLALMGAILATHHWIGNLSIASFVGFIAVAGVAARNAIMMLSHYLHLMKHEGEVYGKKLIIRGTLERLVPVLMTALSAGIALIPLVLAAGEPGKEILHPVAVAIVGGLVTSTILDFFVTPAAFLLFGKRSAEKAILQNAAAAH